MTRLEAVAIARTWNRTDYVLSGRIKGNRLNSRGSRGGGVDCATLLTEYMIEIGVTTEAKLIEVGFYKEGGISHAYSQDWFCHTDVQHYLRTMLKLSKLIAETVCRKGEKAQPGDIVLFRAVGSKNYNHGAIVTKWPFGMHAQYDGVREVDLSSNIITAYRPMDIFSPFEETQ